MLVSLQGARIDGVLSFFFLKQVSSDLLQVWVLVCCVFIFAVDCIWDYCPVVLCSSSCWGMNHKINSVMKTVPRIHNLGQKLLRILQLFRIVPSGCLSGRFGTAMTSLLAPPLSLLFSQGQKLSSWTSTLFFGGRGKKEVFVINSFLKNFILKLDIVTSIFRNIFAQDCRIDLACLTFFNTYLVTFSWIWFIFICLVIWIFYCSVVLQDYHWWWRSFLTGGCTALYFFLYSIHFFFTKLAISGTASTFLYFGYTLIMVLIFFLFTGKNTNNIDHL